MEYRVWAVRNAAGCETGEWGNSTGAAGEVVWPGLRLGRHMPRAPQAANGNSETEWKDRLVLTGGTDDATSRLKLLAGCCCHKYRHWCHSCLRGKTTNGNHNPPHRRSVYTVVVRRPTQVLGLYTGLLFPGGGSSSSWSQKSPAGWSLRWAPATARGTAVVFFTLFAPRPY